MRFLVALTLIFVYVNPFHALGISLPLSIYEYSGIGLLFFFVLGFRQNIQLIRSNDLGFPVQVLMYALVSIVVSLCVYYYFNLSLPFDVEKRALIQSIAIIVSFVLGFYLYFYLSHSFLDVKRYLEWGLWLSLLFIALQVLFQIDHVGRIGGGVTRFTALSGEPKGYAAYLMPILLSIFYGIKRHWLLKGLLLTVYLLTYSTSSFLAFVVSFLMIALLQGQLRSIFFVLMGFIFILLLSQIPEFYHAYYYKIVSLFDEGLIKPSDSFVYIPFLDARIIVDGTEASGLTMLMENWWIAIAGVGFGFDSVYSYYYLNPDTMGFIPKGYDGVISPNNAVLSNILNYGVLVYVFVLFFIARQIILGYRVFESQVFRYKYGDGPILLVYFLTGSAVSNLLTFSNSFKVIPLIFIALYLKNTRLLYADGNEKS